MALCVVTKTVKSKGREHRSSDPLHLRSGGKTVSVNASATSSTETSASAASKLSATSSTETSASAASKLSIWSSPQVSPSSGSVSATTSVSDSLSMMSSVAPLLPQATSIMSKATKTRGICGDCFFKISPVARPDIANRRSRNINLTSLYIFSIGVNQC